MAGLFVVVVQAGSLEALCRACRKHPSDVTWRPIIGSKWANFFLSENGLKKQKNILKIVACLLGESGVFFVSLLQTGFRGWEMLLSKIYRVLILEKKEGGNWYQRSWECWEYGALGPGMLLKRNFRVSVMVLKLLWRLTAKTLETWGLEDFVGLSWPSWKVLLLFTFKERYLPGVFVSFTVFFWVDSLQSDL